MQETQVGIQKVSLGGGGGEGVKNLIFFCFSHHIQREEGVHTNILSGPPSDCQQNAISMEFCLWSGDGTW